MASPQWRERLRQELHRQRLPSGYVDRLVEELSDHATDLFLEDQSMDAEQIANTRLGTPDQLAAAAKVEYQRRTFAGRHPLLMFVAGPVPVTIATLLMTLLLVTYGIGWFVEAICGSDTNAPPTWVVRMMQCLDVAVRFVPFALSTWYFVRLGQRSGQRRWSMAACGIVALTAMLFFTVFDLQSDGHGRWMFGFGWRGWKVSLDQILQAAAPFGLGMWMLRRSHDGDRGLPMEPGRCTQHVAPHAA